MQRALSIKEITQLRKRISDNIELRLSCTITGEMNSFKDIEKYIEQAKKTEINNVIFRSEYFSKNQNLDVYRSLWGKQFTADICSCGHLKMNGVDADFRESDIRLKQNICDHNLYFRDFIYKTDDKLSGSWEFGSQNII
jgi:hypothetical protein